MKTELKENLKNKRRSAEILAVFTKHNFYAGGFTPEELRTTLEDLGPTYVKIGQIMSSRTDMLPESYCRELEKLRTNVKPLEAEIVRSIIEQETGKTINEIYKEFCDTPLGSASIAQAHYGVLKDGTKVVTKVQRPFIADMVRKDFVLLKKLAAIVNAASEADGSGKTIDLISVIGELEKVTEEELDFRIEAENTRSFRTLCIEDDTKVSCPKIIDELTTEKILTQTFVDGYSLARGDKLDRDGIDRNKVGKLIVENYLHQVLDAGIFHGDPHQGNIMISGGVPYWIDFGMIGHISEQNINLIQDIVLSILSQNSDDLANSVMSLASGEVNRSKLTEDIDYLIDRYACVKNLSDIDIGAVMKELTSMLSRHRITVPSELTMLVRSLVTIEGVIEELCPELALFDFLAQKLTQRMKESFDIREKMTSAIRDIAAAGTEVSRAPESILKLMRNLSKGRMKLGVELTGYNELLRELQATVKDISLVLFSCVLFSGSCTLCTTNIEPQTNGIPFIAIFGFVFSAALGIYTVVQMSRRSR